VRITADCAVSRRFIAIHYGIHEDSSVRVAKAHTTLR
jgi:hypothetical protein